MRPPKPRTQKPNLCWRWMRRAWVPFYRVTWTEGGVRKAKELKLDWKGDAKELDRLYWLARGGQHQAQAKPLPYTWRECIIAWRSDPIVQARLAAGTKQSYRPPMDQILEKNGGKDMRLTTRPAIKAALATMAGTPKKASRFAQTISILWNYATNELDWPLGPNPAKKLATYKPRRAYEPWPPWMIDKLPTAPEIVQTAAEIILGTGQRPGAAIAMRRDQIKGDTMALRDDKGDEEFIVHCPARFRAYVDACPGAALTSSPRTSPSRSPISPSRPPSAAGARASARTRRRTASTGCASSRSSSSPKRAARMPRSRQSRTRAPRWWPTTGKRRVA
jgi:hypothetical protein